jgi:RNA polymerase sigma factor (sigma-70 family)
MSDPKKTAIWRLAPAAVATLNLLASAPSVASSPPQDEVRAKLVCAMQAGDRRAFDQLFRSEYAWSCKVVNRAISNPEDVHDVAAAAWQKIWEASDHLRDPQNFRSWASKIITNLAYGQLRTRIRHKSVEDTVPLPASDDEQPLKPDRAQIDPVGDQVIDRLTQQEARDALASAYARLEADLRRLGKRLSPARSDVYRMVLKHLAEQDGSGLRTLRAHLAQELRISRNTASMRLLWIFREANAQGIPLEQILADPDLTRAAQPVFRRVTATLGAGDTRRT